MKNLDGISGGMMAKKKTKPWGFCSDAMACGNGSVMERKTCRNCKNFLVCAPLVLLSSRDNVIRIAYDKSGCPRWKEIEG